MAVYREGYFAVNHISQNSKQIFPDAADYGCPVNKGSYEWNLVKQLIDSYGVEGTRKQVNYATGKSVSHQVKLMNEWAVSDGGMSVEEATEIFSVEFTTCNKGACKGKLGYVVVTKIN